MPQAEPISSDADIVLTNTIFINWLPRIALDVVKQISYFLYHCMHMTVCMDACTQFVALC